MARPRPDHLPEQVDDVRLCHRGNRFGQRVLSFLLGVGGQGQVVQVPP